MDFKERQTNFQEVDRRYAELEQQHANDTLSLEDFDRELERMMIKDAEGRWWAKFRDIDGWKYHDGSEWVPGVPPGHEQAGSTAQSGQNVESSRSEEPHRQQAPGRRADLWLGLGVVCIVVALLFSLVVLGSFVVFGSLGIIFGFLAWRAGRRTGGIATMAASGVCLLVGLLLVFAIATAGT